MVSKNRRMMVSLTGAPTLWHIFVLKSRLDETQQGKIRNYLRLNEQGRQGVTGQDNGKSDSRAKATSSAPTVQSLQEDLAAKRQLVREIKPLRKEGVI
ncbi:MAG: hypothetical protein EOM90_00010 [Alphaproteobacteria bacterium]|nr:hypothetical protein [Alphaproteobacteria bacterium]